MSNLWITVLAGSLLAFLVIRFLLVKVIYSTRELDEIIKKEARQ